MTYEEELENAKDRYRKQLLMSNLAQASEGIGSAISGVDQPKDDFYSQMNKGNQAEVQDVKNKIKEKKQMEAIAGKFQKDERKEKDKISFDLRKEFRQNSEDSKLRMRAYRDIVDATKTASGPGDIKLITSYMKVVEPDSVVREGEFKNAADAGSYMQKVKGYFRGMTFGEKLTKDQRLLFKAAARDMVMNSLGSLETDIKEDYRPLIQDYGLKESTIINPKFMSQLQKYKNEVSRQSNSKSKNAKPKISSLTKKVIGKSPEERQKRILELKAKAGVK